MLSETVFTDNFSVKKEFNTIKNQWLYNTVSVQVSSVAQSCPTLCDPMNRSTPGFPVHHQLPEFTQTTVHRVRDAIQPSHPMLSPFPPAPNPSQHQGLFQGLCSAHQVAKVLESDSASVLPTNIQGWFPLGWTGLISFCPRDSQESPPRPQFETITSSALSLLYGPTLTPIHDDWENHSFDYRDLCQQTDVSVF